MDLLCHVLKIYENSFYNITLFSTKSWFGLYLAESLYCIFLPCMHSVISPKSFGEKSGFSKGFYLGGSQFSNCLGRNGFGEEFECFDFCLGEVCFFIIHSIFWHFRHQKFKIFSNHSGIKHNLKFDPSHYS